MGGLFIIHGKSYYIWVFFVVFQCWFQGRDFRAEPQDPSRSGWNASRTLQCPFSISCIGRCKMCKGSAAERSDETGMLHVFCFFCSWKCWKCRVQIKNPLKEDWTWTSSTWSSWSMAGLMGIWWSIGSIVSSDLNHILSQLKLLNLDLSGRISRWPSDPASHCLTHQIWIIHDNPKYTPKKIF